MDINIREYNDSDYKFVNAILNESFDVEKSNVSNSIAHEFVAVYDGKVVGYFYLLDSIDIVENIKCYFLEYLCVDSNYRGLGIANSMMEYIFDYSKKNDVKRIELTSNKHRVAAHGLYKKYGFIVRDTVVFRKDLLWF